MTVLFPYTRLHPGGRFGLGSVAGPPLWGDISTLFGAVDADHQQPHTGLDIAAPEGTPIESPTSGLVLDVFAIGVGEDNWEAVFGNSVIIQYGEYVCLFAHMTAPPLVREGDRVQVGTPLGRVGSTGQSTGPHLHWGLAPVENRYLLRDHPAGLVDLLAYIGRPGPDVERAMRLLTEAMDALRGS